MKLKFWPRLNRDSMSSRARGILIVASVHFLFIGLTILLQPNWYSGVAFVAMAEYSGLPPWGSVHMATGLLCGVAAITAWPSFARAGLIMAFVVLTVSAFAVGWGVVQTWFDADPVGASPVVPITFLALAAKDILMVSRPLRTPLEDQTIARAEQEAG